MGNQASNQLDGTIRRIEGLKNKPEQLKQELQRFVEQVPLDHSIDMKVDKKLFDILMGLIKYELSQPVISLDIHVIMAALQRLLRVRGFYLAIPKCSIIPLLEAVQCKDQVVVLSSLSALSYLLDCRCPPDKKFDRDQAEMQAKQAFFESRGYEILIRLLVKYGRSEFVGIISKIVDMLALDLSNHVITTRFVAVQKILTMLTPHIDLLISFSTHTHLQTRCYSSILLQGFLLHSSLTTMTQLQTKLIEEGHILWYILFSIDGSALPSSHDYRRWYDKNLTELSRNLLEYLCANNDTIVEIIRKCIPKNLQLPMEEFNGNKATAAKKPVQKDKEPIRQSLWNLIRENQIKIIKLSPQLSKLDTEVKLPHCIWNLTTKMELCDHIRLELDHLKTQRSIDKDIKWDYEGFEIQYPSLKKYLRVGNYYISLLLPVLQDKQSPYILQRELLQPLIASLFQRAVVEDDVGWKLACIRAISGLYEKFPEILTELEIIPYLCWLIHPEHMNPMWRDHILVFFKTLLKHEGNVKRFVASEGIRHLLFYISRILTLPDAQPVTKKSKAKPGAKKKKGESDDEEEEKKNEKADDESDDDQQPADGDDAAPRPIQKQNLLRNLPPELTVPELATLSLELLALIQSSGPRMRRIMAEKDVVNTLIRLLMSSYTAVKEQAVKLLIEIVDASPYLVPQLITTGMFSFLLCGLRAGLTPTLIELINKYHMKQDVKIVPKGESALSSYFPKGMADVLNKQGAQEWANLFDKDINQSDLIWNANLRKHLFEVMQRRLSHFKSALANDPWTEYKFTPPEPIRYPSLESELCMAGVYLRQLNETGGVPELMDKIQIENPEQFINELVRAINAHKYAGIDLLNILTSQVIIIRRFPQLDVSREYRAFESLLEIVGNQQSEQDFPIVEKAAELVHVLLALQDSANINLFLQYNGVNLLQTSLEFFSNFDVNNVLVQRIIVDLLNIVYDVGINQIEAIEHLAGDKAFTQPIFSYIGRLSAVGHPALSIVTCKALMALTLSQSFQSNVLQSGAILHLIDMSMFYRSASDASASPGPAAPAPKMNEERRVRLSGASVLSLLAGFPSASVQPPAHPQLQKIINNILTPPVFKLLQNPSDFVTKITAINEQLSVLSAYLAKEISTLASNGEWLQKQWPEKPLKFVVSFDGKLAPPAAGTSAPRPVESAAKPSVDSNDSSEDQFKTPLSKVSTLKVGNLKQQLVNNVQAGATVAAAASTAAAASITAAATKAANSQEAQQIKQKATEVTNKIQAAAQPQINNLKKAAAPAVAAASVLAAPAIASAKAELNAAKKEAETFVNDAKPLVQQAKIDAAASLNSAKKDAQALANKAAAAPSVQAAKAAVNAKVESVKQATPSSNELSKKMSDSASKAEKAITGAAAAFSLGAKNLFKRASSITLSPKPAPEPVHTQDEEEEEETVLDETDGNDVEDDIDNDDTEEGQPHADNEPAQQQQQQQAQYDPAAEEEEQVEMNEEDFYNGTSNGQSSFYGHGVGSSSLSSQFDAPLPSDVGDDVDPYPEDDLTDEQLDAAEEAYDAQHLDEEEVMDQNDAQHPAVDDARDPYRLEGL